MVPYTVLPPGSDNPRDLWKWMAAYEDRTGGRVLAIAHNGNLSNGRMFPIVEPGTDHGQEVLGVEWANESAIHSGGKISDSQLGRASLASSDAGAEHGIGQHRGPSGAIAPVLSPKNRPAPGPIAPGKPRRFYGSVEIDMVRPVKSFDAIHNAVVMELQRTQGAKVKLTLEIEAEASEGFAIAEVGVVRDNARQLKFNPESTGFEE